MYKNIVCVSTAEPAGWSVMADCAHVGPTLCEITGDAAFRQTAGRIVRFAHYNCLLMGSAYQSIAIGIVNMNPDRRVQQLFTLSLICATTLANTGLIKQFV